MNRIYKIGYFSGEVSKPKTFLKKDTKDKADKTTQERCVEDDVVAKTRLMVDAENLKMPVKEGCVASTNSPLGLEASGVHRKAAHSNSAPLGKLTVATESRNALPLSGASTKRSKMVGVSMPKPTGTHLEPARSKPKTGGDDNDEVVYVLNENGRRTDIGEEEDLRYRNVTNDTERMELDLIKFCAPYEHLVASATCTKALHIEKAVFSSSPLKDMTLRKIMQ